jgi:hypothetical protein
LANASPRFRTVSDVALSVLVVVGAWILSSSDTVAFRAEALAGAQPYCIQVSANQNYAPARSRFDLSALSMWGDNGNNHAVLVIGDARQPALWHWSYREQDFAPDADGTKAIFCTPAQHFANKLSWVRPPAPENIEFHLSGLDFSVPKAYEPSVMSEGRKGMTLSTQGQDFRPGKPLHSALGGHDAFTMVSFDGNRAHLTAETTGRVQAAGAAFGLQKRWVYGSGSTSPQAEYFAFAPDGRVTTRIACVESEVGECLHHFERNGWTYEFHHPSNELAHWQELERNLSERVESFLHKTRG